MSEQKETLLGLNCPNCGGAISIPEGQVIVKCPYCEMRSFVRGERGLRRYQVSSTFERNEAAKTLHRFLSSSMAIAPDARRTAQMSEAFLVYLPFWAVWGRVMGWAFGKERVGSGDKKRYVPKEIKIVEEMSWNGAACDVGEFGVAEVPLTNQKLEPFRPDELHSLGLVFEPVNSEHQAQDTAKAAFENRIQRRASLDRPGQLFVRSLRRRTGLVYYPLWILRYLHRGRSFQVVVDGHSGSVLYGKAPGNILYRAAVLVLGMALGAFLALDVSSLVLWGAARSESDNALGIGLVLLVVGLGIMAAAYRIFRHGEQYEYRHSGKGFVGELFQNKNYSGSMQDVEKWMEMLN